MLSLNFFAGLNPAKLFGFYNQFQPSMVSSAGGLGSALAKAAKITR